MPRYIDANKIKLTGITFSDVNNEVYFSLSDVRKAIEQTPTADVVEVVRCKDCKYQDDCDRRMVHRTRDYVLEQNISTYNKVDFCSYGERKEQE